MRVIAKIPSLRYAIAGEEKKLARAITAGMGDGTGELKQALRNDMLAAGLGDRLAKTWQGKVYPQRQASLHPTGFIWSKAPQIASFYDGDNEILPINGHSYLAIPSARAKAITGKKGRRLTVAEVMAKLKRRLIIIKGKKGNLLGLIDDSIPARGKRRAGLKRNLVLLFTFVRQVKGRKRLDVKALVGSIAPKIPNHIAARMAQ